MSGLHIVGRRGRIGAELDRLAQREGVVLTDDVDTADVVVLAVPSHAAARLLADGSISGTVIDMSGALKAAGAGRYGLLSASGRLLDGGQPRPGERLANPGCLAASVILGLQAVGLDRGAGLAGPLHICAVGGASMAARGQQGGVRLARRLHDHPHVQEIEAALPGVVIDSFAPVISYAQPRGILAVITGRLAAGEQADRVSDQGVETLDVALVEETAEVRYRLTLGRAVEPRPFTLGVVLDNLSFPAANALRLAQLVMGGAAGSPRA